MTVNELNAAISLIDDRYLDMVESDEKEIKQMSGTHKTKSIHRRLVAALIAAVLLVLGSSVAAFALNEDFRMAVLSFFKIQAEDTVEQVSVESLPLQPTQENESSQEAIPEVTVSRVFVPNYGTAHEGLFYVCTDEVEYNSGSRYDIYIMSGGELSQLQKHEFNAICRIDGKEYPIQLEWAENGGVVGIGYVGGPELTDGSPTDGAYIVCQTFYAGGPKALLLLDNRPLIADLANNTASPVKMSIDGSLPGDICVAEISKDGTTLLLQTSNPNGKYYSAEVASGKLCCLNDLCGSYLYGCRFASDNQLVCWSVTGGISQEDMEEVLAQQASGQETTDTTVDCGKISAWVVSLDSETAKLVMSGAPATVYTNPDAILIGPGNNYSDTSGILCMTGRYAVERKTDGTLVVYDFIENTQTSPDNLILSTANSLDMIASPDGTRLLLVERNRDDDALIRISVLDMSENRFIIIDRDPSAVGNEHWADWFDKDTVLVDNNTYDVSGNNTGESWYYLYRIGN